MPFYFDVTKSDSSRQLSGLIRVSENLRQALRGLLGEDLVAVIWHSRRRQFLDATDRSVVALSSEDAFLTPEVFSSKERPGYHEHLEGVRIRRSAIFHDAIPIKFPEITWPKSVSRHPQYMEDLARFDHVFSVSKTSQEDLIEYWNQRQISRRPELSTIQLGADFFDQSERRWIHKPQDRPLILNVGILEPRKNQDGLMDVAVRLWKSGLKFELHFVGRVNPHFGKPIRKRILKEGKAGYPVALHAKQSDDHLLDLYSRAIFTVFNSRVEGFGLPVVESLWLGVPCISRDLPSLSHLQLGASCPRVKSDGELEESMKTWLEDPEEMARATQAARNLNLPTWEDAARGITAWANSQ